MKKVFGLFAAVMLAGCGSGPSPTSLGPTVSVTPAGFNASDPNVMPVQVACGYPDEPCVSVKVCNPQTGICQIVDNVLLDTGSYGLRLFASTIASLNLQTVASGSGTLAECTQYIDGSSDWGPIALANVTLSGDSTTRPIPIQMIDSTYPGIPSADCPDPDPSPATVGFNGILGLGLFVADCGAPCVTEADNKNYYSCANGVCTGTTVPLDQQVPNPIAYLGTDNNGMAMILPNLPGGFAARANGYVILGIGTRSNNKPAPGVKVFAANSDGLFTTSFNGETYTNAAFIDSGSSGLFFPSAPGLPTCPDTGAAISLYCPASAVGLSAVQTGTDGKTSETVNFSIDNASFDLVGNPNLAFADLGGYMPGGFDWGLPFFFGRTIYVGLTNDVTTSAPSPFAGVEGPYWAY